MELSCPYRQHDGLMPIDPCMDYLSIRDAEPVRRDDDLGVWIVTGLRQVTELLRSPALSSAWPERGRTRLHDEQSGTADGMRTADIVRRWFMFNDAPRHQRLRSLIAPSSPRTGSPISSPLSRSAWTFCSTLSPSRST